MNKTVSINLGGFFFHIDEDAYQKLNHYFDAIRRSLAPDGKDEIMSDIEGRIAELLNEKLKNDKQVVSIREVEEVVAIMGEPEDYRIDDEGPAQKSIAGSYYSTGGYVPPRTKKFYRDGDKAMIGGVCAGLAHYFRIDPLWLRIIFVISLFISFGASIFIYILLWVLIPKAITTTEKLEMTGEPINISNIEKKVREEFEALGTKFQNVDYEKMGNDARRGAERVGNGLGRVFTAIFKGFAKLIGAFITIFAAVSIIAVVIMFFIALFSSSLPGRSIWFPYADGFNYTGTPIWLIGLLGLFAIAIPLFVLFLLGLKILVENLRPIGTITKTTLLLLWIISIAGLIYVGVAESNEVSHRGKTFERKELTINPADTLNIKFKYNSYFSKTLYKEDELRFTQDMNGNNIIYSNNVYLYIMKTDEAVPYLQIEKISLGNSASEARERAGFIDYNFVTEGNTLILDNYFITGSEHKYRGQQVELYLYLPEGMVFYPDASVKEYDDTDNSFFDLWFDSENVYRMEEQNVKCLTCNEQAGEEEGEMMEENINLSGASGNIKINGEEIRVNLKDDKDSLNISISGTRTNN
ncbi:PspC domain-containing protein [Flavobacterium sp. D11R37]|uniref:PspC domain-containing protein n=1 Tax=Flavobacterium coralii TaxID=2838017 RepID=UPI001CA69552|nr:PspC domain-containing protein [Flavobacterium coralii]MBY8961690.1 PspC domain-containing protein [Flavobacterium coralii]